VPTIFTRIINGEIPGTFVWRDDTAVAFLSINPLRPGHALVVPRVEVDHWVDLDTNVAQHVMEVAQAVGRAQRAAFSPRRIGLLVVGDEVPHAHLHVVPINLAFDLDFAKAAPTIDPSELEANAELIRTELRAAGHDEADA
jgi:histidine triad (HIT) family protein